MRRAVQLLGSTEEVEVRRVAPLYRTAPLGIKDQPEFFNSVVEIKTTLEPRELLARLLAVEAALGRIRGERWGPRVVDLDLLLYEDVELSTPALTVPHPRLKERAFVVVPLARLAPGMLLPGGLTARELAARLKREQRIKKVVDEWLMLS
uniref:2-amino-4-hydroxy-6-hydroxymethyldihydropteridine diphosphokinase n=1 Tax=Ammonifex degensii TaxID=42838 RepID=A0A7C1JC03_9THEO